MFLFYTAHIAICVLVILVILFQDGKTGGLTGVADNASQQVFGAKGAGSFLTKLTTGLAIAFMFTSLTLAIFNKSEEKSIAEDYKPDTPKTEESSVETPDPVNTSEQPPATGEEPDGDVIITDKDGKQHTGTLNDAIKSIEIVPSDQVPEDIKKFHEFDHAPASKKHLIDPKKAAKKDKAKKQN
jgi:preprotein translocase subunit SecG